MEEGKKWVMPHIIKIPEAYTALIDERYKRVDEGSLIVFSSDYSKQYTVTIFADGYASNDNMSYNKKILGYPIVVALMLENRITIDREIASLFSKINWTKTNIEYGKNFTLSMDAVIKTVSNEIYSYDSVYMNIQNAYEQLEELIGRIKRYESSVSFKDSMNV